MYNNEFHRLGVILYVVFILEIFRMIVSEAQSELSKFAPVIRRNGIHMYTARGVCRAVSKCAECNYAKSNTKFLRIICYMMNILYEKGEGDVVTIYFLFAQFRYS
jgi:hypothetical protein